MQGHHLAEDGSLSQACARLGEAAQWDVCPLSASYQPCSSQAGNYRAWICLTPPSRAEFAAHTQHRASMTRWPHGTGALQALDGHHGAGLAALNARPRKAGLEAGGQAHTSCAAGTPRWAMPCAPKWLRPSAGAWPRLLWGQCLLAALCCTYLTLPMRRCAPLNPGVGVVKHALKAPPFSDMASASAGARGAAVLHEARVSCLPLSGAASSDDVLLQGHTVSATTGQSQDQRRLSRWHDPHALPESCTCTPPPG